ncbi:hypothetical protein BCON_0224g00200 [Botryotinia convoluta]|uniref:Uncharacterized protein n=1 Tax=Botryotinia convoluta TaxID=54673 RepID=A0A4Z1HNY7_9HELO|nr:hypothetical protein BCON_0224g00200 [Botryotinia convoluta]
MVYGRAKLRKAQKPNYANAHKAHLGALESRRESAKKLLKPASRQKRGFKLKRGIELTYFALLEARRVAAEAAAIIEASQPKLSRKEARAAAAKAAKQEERRDRRIAEANAAEVTRLLANDAVHFARRMYALRLRDPRVGGDFADVNEEEDEYEDYGEEEEPETLDEFKTRVLG